MKRTFIFFIVVLSAINLFGSPKRKSTAHLMSQLKEYSKYSSFNDSLMHICNRIVDTLTVRKRHDESLYGTVLFDMTNIYGVICQKANSQLAVDSYIHYLMNNKGSAEEQLGDPFEPIFKKNPILVITEIEKNHLRARDTY